MLCGVYRILGFGLITFEACLEKLFKIMKTENRKKKKRIGLTGPNQPGPAEPA
jgi:hypothetical protein